MPLRSRQLQRFDRFLHKKVAQQLKKDPDFLFKQGPKFSKPKSIKSKYTRIFWALELNNGFMGAPFLFRRLSTARRQVKAFQDQGRCTITKVRLTKL